MKPSGIGGQAVIEGIMMRNKNKYSIAVRKPDNEIEVVVKESRDLTEKHQWLNFPIIRGIVSFVDSLVTGISTINYSASFYDDPAEQEKTKIDEVGKNILKDKFESVLMAVTVILSIFFAIGLFMVLPYLAARLVSKYIISKTLLNFIEGVVRLLIFVIYIFSRHIGYKKSHKNGCHCSEHCDDISHKALTVSCQSGHDKDHYNCSVKKICHIFLPFVRSRKLFCLSHADLGNKRYR